jgi:hypothetical protein
VLELLDAGIESFLRGTASLSATDVDVSFEAPDREWSGKLSRPTVNVFLWDIKRSKRSPTGVESFVQNGVRMQRHALPVLELRYVITTWTSEHSDERAVLSALMRSLLNYQRVPLEFLPDDIKYLGEPDLTLQSSGEEHVDVFKALEGQLKPSINAVMFTKFDLDAATPAAPAVGEIGLQTGLLGSGPQPIRRRVAGEVLNPEAREAIGVPVRSRLGETVVNSAGQFLIRADAGDEIIVETDPPLIATVPPAGGVRFE